MDGARTRRMESNHTEEKEQETTISADTQPGVLRIILLVAVSSILTTAITSFVAPLLPQLMMKAMHARDVAGDITRNGIHAMLKPFFPQESHPHTSTAHSPDVYKCSLHTYATSIVSQDPLLIYLHGFVHPREADMLISQATPQLAPAKVISNEGGEEKLDNRLRDASATFLQHNTTYEQQCLFARMLSLSGGNAESFELFSVSRFTHGQGFDWHKDWISKDGLKSGNDWWARYGQRIMSFQMYLSDGYTGGETVFSKIFTKTGVPVRFKPRKGDALFFFNTKIKENEMVEDDRMVYKEEVVQTGVKWTLNGWIRGKVSWMEQEQGAWNQPKP